MFVPEQYQDYKYLVECNDNYFVLSKNHHIYGYSGDPATINVIYQYISPSIYTIEGTYTSESSNTFVDVSSSFSDNIFDRGDFPLIFICNFITLFFFAFIVNQLSKIVKKGGVFRFVLTSLTHNQRFSA